MNVFKLLKIDPWKAIQWALGSIMGDKPGRKYTALLKLADKENKVQEATDALVEKLGSELGLDKVAAALGSLAD